MLGGATRGWRVRLYAPGSGTDTDQVYFRAPAGEGEPWKRVLRRAASEGEARKIFAQTEAERQRRASLAEREKNRNLPVLGKPRVV